MQIGQRKTIPASTFPSPQVPEAQLKIGKVSLVFYLILQRQIQKNGILVYSLIWVWYFSGSMMSWI